MAVLNDIPFSCSFSVLMPTFVSKNNRLQTGMLSSKVTALSYS